MWTQLNNFCVTRRVGLTTVVRWPPEQVTDRGTKMLTYRGTAMPRVHRAFFQPGKKYRAPMFVATSFEESTSVHTFLMRLDPPTADQTPPFQEPTLWRFHLDASLSAGQRCKHVNFIDRTDGTVHGEDEFLYSPYSVFTVTAVSWHEAPLVNEYIARPHTIDVDVAPDNRCEPLDLPLAPWC